MLVLSRRTKSRSWSAGAMGLVALLKVTGVGIKARR